ncbi:MAG: hypothetical protein GX025_05410 [Clostridiales bacterium]|nr:hypothetical protein [Clostridiales bacterium]
MRVSDRTTVRNFLKYLDNAKTKTADTNERIASGNRFKRISDDVSAGTRVLRVRSDLAKTEEHYDNVKAINEQMATTETTMMSISDILVDVHSKKVIRALDDTAGEAGRNALANEIKAMREEILQFANTKYGTFYVLGGSTATAPPFTLGTNGELLYNKVSVDNILYDEINGHYYDSDSGNPIPMDDPVYADIGIGIRMQGSDVESDTAFKMSYSGLEVLGFGVNSDGISKNVYNQLAEIEKAIRANDMEKLRAYDNELVLATDKLTANLTDIGAKTNFLDTIQKGLENRIDSFNSQVNTFMGINDAEEAMNQTMNDYVLKAILQLGSNILPMSLMDYLR